MASSALDPRPARGPLLRGIAGIVALYAALAGVVGYLTRSPDPGDSSGRAAAPDDPAAEPPGRIDAGAMPGPAPAPPTYAPAEILAAPAVVQQEPVVPLPPEREDRAEALSDLRKQRVAEMLEQQAKRGERARAAPAGRAR